MTKAAPKVAAEQVNPAVQDASGATEQGGGVLAPLPTGSGALSAVLGADFAAQLAQEAKDAAAKERPAFSKISLRSGVLSYQGNPVKGNKMSVVIVAMAYERVYYKNKFNPNVIVNPNCFALSLSEEDMVPHENVTEPINATCDDCPLNEWGSDVDGRRGKACKEKRRLILLPADCLTSVDDVKKAEMAFVSLPVMSVKGWAQYVNVLNATLNAPAFCVVTELGCVPDPKSQFRVTFNAMNIIKDKEVLLAVMARREEAERLAITPYDETAGEEAKEEKGPSKF